MAEENALDLPTLFDPETCTRKGLCPVSSIRNRGDPFESHSLYFEQHGTGPEHVVFIMGYAFHLQVMRRTHQQPTSRIIAA